MLILIIILIWIVVGNLFGILSYRWDMGYCPPRYSILIFCLIGPVSIIIFLGIFFEKVMNTPWWDKPIC